MTRSLTRALLALACSLAACPAWADGLVRDGVGAISIGRGGTNIAHYDNGAIILDNPAAMAHVFDEGLAEIGVDTLITDLDYTDPENSAIDGRFRMWPSPNLAYIRNPPDRVFAWGLGVFAPAGFGAEYRMTHPLWGPSTYKSLGMLMKVLPAVALRITDRLSVGGTLGVAVTHAELEGPVNLQTGLFRGAFTRMDLQATGAACVYSAGLMYQLTDDTTIGLAYTSETRHRLDGHLRADVFLFPSSEFDAELDLVWPRSLGIGLKHDLGQFHRVSCDVIWYDWSHAFDRLDLKLTNPSHPFYTLFGPEIRDTFPLDWQDSISVRLGYEWACTDRDILRLGYVYHESPVPDATLMPYLDGVLDHAVSAGWSHRLRRCAFTLAYQYSFGRERQVEDSALVGDDFTGSTFSAQAHWINLSLLWPF